MPTDDTRGCPRCEELRADIVKRAATGENPDMDLHDWVAYLDDSRKYAEQQLTEIHEDQRRVMDAQGRNR